MGQSSGDGTSQQAKLLPFGGGGMRFGSEVAIDGDTAIVGAPREIDFYGGAGVAYVFVRTGAIWTQQAVLEAQDAPLDRWFGGSVAIDGDTAIVGAPFDDNGGNNFNSGAAYVFTRTGVNWTQQAKLLASDTFDLRWFGHSVTVDGDTAVIGAPFHDNAGIATGAAYGFTRAAGVWTQDPIMTASDAFAGDFFGWSVSLSGSVVAIGADLDDDMGVDSGSAYVFERGGASWSQSAKITASNGAAGDQFGVDVALDGSVVVVGSILGDGDATDSGTAYVFERQFSAWPERALLKASDGEAGDGFGASVAVSGPNAWVGAFYDDDAGTDAGAAYLYTGSGSSWAEDSKTTGSDTATDDWFGYAVAASGSTLLAGAPYDDDTGGDGGAAFVFEVGPHVAIYCTAKTSSLGCVPSIGSAGVPGFSEPGPFDITCVQVNSSKNGIFFYGLNGRASFPFQGGIMCAQPPLKRTPVQNSGGSPPPGDCTGTFTFDFNAWVQGGSDPNVVPGSQVNGGWWFRDPQASFTTGLSNAIEFVEVP